MAIFGKKNHGLTSLEKCQFFDFLNFFFYSLKRRFFVVEYRKRHFPVLYCLKKKLEKWPFLDKNHGLTPLEKCRFFDFFNLLFLYPRKAFFCWRISKKTFSSPTLPKKKIEKWPFLDQNHGLTPLEKCQFFYFLRFLFL